MARVEAEECPLVNHSDGFGGHPEGVRGVIQGGGVGSKLFRVGNFLSTPLSSTMEGGWFEQECSPYPEVARVASGWVSQESIPDHGVV